MLENVDDVGAVAVEDGVDDRNVGLRSHAGQCDLGGRTEAAGRGQPAQLHREQQLEQHPDEEHRGGVEQHRQQPQDHVGHAVAVRCGKQPQRDSDDHRDQQGPYRQLQGGGAVDHDQVADRASVGQRGAEVAAEQAGEIVPVLRQQRTVEPRRRLALGDLRRGESAAGGRGDRVPDTTHQEEHQGDQDPRGRDDQQRPHAQITGQGAVARLPAGTLGRLRGGGRRRLRGGRHAAFFAELCNGANSNLNDLSRVTPSMSLPATAICFPVSSGIVDK